MTVLKRMNMTIHVVAKEKDPRARLRRYVDAFPTLAKVLDADEMFIDLMKEGRWEDARAYARQMNRAIRQGRTFEDVMTEVERLRARRKEENRAATRKRGPSASASEQAQLDAEREHRRQMRNSQEYAALYAEGMTLGIAESELQEALAKGIPEAKRLIGERQRRARIIASATELGFETYVELLLMETHDYTLAEEWLRQARELLGRAAKCGATEEVRRHLALDRVSDAKSFLHAAEQCARQQLQRDGLISRIQRLHPNHSLRIELEPRAIALNPTLPARQWRIALHEIERQLNK